MDSRTFVPNLNMCERTNKRAQNYATNKEKNIVFLVDVNDVLTRYVLLLLLSESKTQIISIEKENLEIVFETGQTLTLNVFWLAQIYFNLF